MVSDTKKVQTVVNRAADLAEAVRATVEDFKALRTLFQTANPDTTGTVLENNLTALNTSLNVIDTEISKPVWDTIITAKAPTHRGKAL